MKDKKKAGKTDHGMVYEFHCNEMGAFMAYCARNIIRIVDMKFVWEHSAKYLTALNAAYSYLAEGYEELAVVMLLIAEKYGPDALMVNLTTGDVGLLLIEKTPHDRKMALSFAKGYSLVAPMLLIDIFRETDDCRRSAFLDLDCGDKAGAISRLKESAKGIKLPLSLKDVSTIVENQIIFGDD